MARFHSKHGDNIRLLDNGTVACRVESYNNGIVFTECPVDIGTVFQVKIIDSGGMWSGKLVSN